MNDINEIEVLLVEDNPHDAEMTMRALRKCNVESNLLWVKDGVEALDFIHCTGVFERRDPHAQLKLVLLDLKMPRLDGLDVLRALKSDESTAALPVVVMTSSNQDRDIAESYRLGVNGYVTKPVRVALFMEQVQNIGLFWLSANQSPQSTLSKDIAGE